MKRLSDSEKLEQLYCLYEQKMYAAAFSVLHDRYQAEDTVQEAFVRLLKNIRKIKEPDSQDTQAYVFKVIKTTAIDQYRKNKTEIGKHVSLDDKETADSRDDISKVVSNLANQMMLEQVLTKLPDSYREIIIYRFVHQLSIKETAAVLEIKEEAVRKRQQRALAKIKTLIGDEKYEYSET